MEHIAALLLIVGCSQDMSHCDELPAPVPIFETSAECDAELARSLRELSSQRPRVMGTCVFVDPAMEEEDAELVWDVTRDGRIVATIERAGMTVAGLSHSTRTNR